jgi:hypothetical protein
MDIAQTRLYTTSLSLEIRTPQKIILDLRG